MRKRLIVAVVFLAVFSAFALCACGDAKDETTPITDVVPVQASGKTVDFGIDSDLGKVVITLPEGFTYNEKTRAYDSEDGQTSIWVGDGYLWETEKRFDKWVDPEDDAVTLITCGTNEVYAEVKNDTSHGATMLYHVVFTEPIDGVYCANLSVTNDNDNDGGDISKTYTGEILGTLATIRAK